MFSVILGQEVGNRHIPDKKCCISATAAESSLSRLERVQRGFRGRMGDKYFPRCNSSPREEKSLASPHSIVIYRIDVQANYSLIPPVQTSTTRTHKSTYTFYSSSFPSYFIVIEKFPLRLFPKNSSKEIYCTSEIRYIFQG